MTAMTTGYELLTVRVEIEPDDSPDVSWLDGHRCDDCENDAERDICRKSDAKRLRDFHAGDWYMVGVTTRAQVLNHRTGRIQTIHGGSLWGIESDSGGNYFDEVARDCLAELADELNSLGIETTADELAEMANWYE